MINTRKISIIKVGGFRPTGNPLASHFGLTPMALPEEQWPTFRGPQRLSAGTQQVEHNLFFICQLNLTELPYLPELLSDIKLITLFVNPDSCDADYFCIRTYKSLDGLVPMQIPERHTFQKGFEVSYELGIDQPVYDDPDLILPDGITLSDKESENIIEQLVNKHCSKIGGYASSIQYAPFSENQHLAKPKFCLQIDSEEKIGLMWGDSGTFYIARGTEKGFEDIWFADCQFY